MFQKPHCGFTLSKHVEISIKSITLLYCSIKKAKEWIIIGLSLLFIFSLDKWTSFYTIKELQYSLNSDIRIWFVPILIKFSFPTIFVNTEKSKKFLKTKSSNHCHFWSILGPDVGNISINKPQELQQTSHLF